MVAGNKSPLNVGYAKFFIDVDFKNPVFHRIFKILLQFTVMSYDEYVSFRNFRHRSAYIL
mgnify:CR=1 FL=1